MSDLGQQMNEMGVRARAAASVLAYASPEAKTKALLTAANAMVAATDHIITENAKDLDFGREKGLTDAMMDRHAGRGSHRGDGPGAAHHCGAGRSCGRGNCRMGSTHGPSYPSCAHPLGVIGVIYEPSQCHGRCGGLVPEIGNAVILRGGSESLHSAAAIHACLVQGLQARVCPKTPLKSSLPVIAPRLNIC